MTFMDYIQEAFSRASQWNQDNSYSKLTGTAQCILPSLHIPLLILHQCLTTISPTQLSYPSRSSASRLLPPITQTRDFVYALYDRSCRWLHFLPLLVPTAPHPVQNSRLRSPRLCSRIQTSFTRLRSRRAMVVGGMAGREKS